MSVVAGWLGSAQGMRRVFFDKPSRLRYRADLTLRTSHFLKLQLPEVPHFLNFKKFRVTFAQKVWIG